MLLRWSVLLLGCTVLAQRSCQVTSHGSCDAKALPPARQLTHEPCSKVSINCAALESCLACAHEVLRRAGIGKPVTRREHRWAPAPRTYWDHSSCLAWLAALWTDSVLWSVGCEPSMPFRIPQAEPGAKSQAREPISAAASTAHCGRTASRGLPCDRRALHQTLPQFLGCADSRNCVLCLSCDRRGPSGTPTSPGTQSATGRLRQIAKQVHLKCIEGCIDSFNARETTSPSLTVLGRSVGVGSTQGRAKLSPSLNR